jgi:Tol biopolymer transport system component
VNSSASDRSPIVAPSGTLYFTSNRGADNLYMARRKGGGFDAPVSLGPNVNGAPYEPMLAVSPDEKTLVFSAMARQDETLAPGRPYPRGDLYVSHWTGTGWGPSVKLGPAINTNASEFSPMFSPNGRTLYFMSERGFATDQDITLDHATLTSGLESNLNGRGNIYAIDVRALDKVQP